jgi:hypothetical protein
MTNLIEQRVEAARRGENPYLITKMASGWLVIGDVQPLPGYCLLLADPVVESPNALDEAERVRYALDVLRIGDALLEITGAYRINYMTLATSSRRCTRTSFRGLSTSRRRNDALERSRPMTGARLVRLIR